MKRTLKYALSAVITAALVAPALAQDNFPDVPANHWAYEALARMKSQGLLVGYPDGLFRGGRPASRYELAVAIHATYQHLQNQINGINTQIKDLSDRIGAGSGTGNPRGLDDLRNQLTELQNTVRGMQGWGDDIANLRRMADTFQKELQSLGVDVEAMKRDLGDLADRVRRLEARKPSVDVSGDVNFWVGLGTSDDNLYGLTKDGRITGAANALSPFSGGGAGGVGLGGVRDMTILHEAAFTLSGTNDTGPKWRGTIVTGNMFGAPGFINQSGLASGIGYREPGSGDFYIQDLGVRFDTSVAGLGFNVEAGRIGYKVSPMMYQRPDFTSYYSNPRWDDGMWRMDGTVLGFNFGGAKLDLLAGKIGNNTTTVNGIPINSIEVMNSFTTYNSMAMVPTFSIERVLGVNFNVPLTTNGNLNLAYLFLESDDDAIVAGIRRNRLNVFGGNADFNIGRIKLEGGWSQTTQSYNGGSAVGNGIGNSDDNNSAYYAKLGWTSDRWGIWGGYRRVEDQYFAPGDWGRLGIIRNPANIEGFQVGANFDLTGSLKLTAMAEFYDGIRGNGGMQVNPFFDDNTSITRYKINFGYQLNPNLGLMLGHEYNRFENHILANGAYQNPFDSRYAWTSIGLGYGLSSAAKLSMMYEMSDINNEFTGIAAPVGGRNRVFRGGLFTTQLSIKF